MNLAEMIKGISSEDVELIESLDYEHILVDLESGLQLIHDQGEESENNKIIRDVAFIAIQSIIDQAEKLMNNNLSDEDREDLVDMMLPNFPVDEKEEFFLRRFDRTNN